MKQQAIGIIDKILEETMYDKRGLEEAKSRIQALDGWIPEKNSCNK